MGRRTTPGSGGRAGGYTLAAVLVFVTVANVLIAAALPVWSHLARREREQELIFRGLQYAEAIRVFQQRFGRYPVRLDELLTVSPRSIRQLWKDPMNPEGRWGILYAEGALAGGTDQDEVSDEGGRARLSRRGRELVESRRRRQEQREAQRRGRGQLTAGPIVGVHSLSKEQAITRFMEGATYKEWRFTVDILPQGDALVEEVVPSLNARWVGRSFPEGIEPEGGSGPTDAFDDEDDEGGSRQRDLRDRGRRRGGRRRGG